MGGVKGEKNEEGETKGDGGKAEDNVLYTLPQGSGIIGVRYVAEETEREREREREFDGIASTSTPYPKEAASH